MKFTPATLLAIAAGASAQISLPLPDDLQAYTSSLAQAGNTDALSAVSGLFAFSDIQSVVAGALAHSITGAALPLSFNSAAQAWISAQPASAQPLATSVYNDIATRALTDGLLDSLQTLQPGAVPTGANNATVTAVGPVATGNSTANSTTAAGNVSVAVEPTVITSGTVVISTSVTRTSGPSAVATTTSPGAAAILTGPTGMGAGLIAALFAAVAAL